MANAFLVPLAGPATTKPLIISAIDAPYDCAIFQIVNYVYRARILCQPKQIWRRQAQNLSQSESNYAGVGDDEGALPLIRCHDLAYPRCDALLKLAEGLGAGDRLARKPLDP